MNKKTLLFCITLISFSMAYADIFSGEDGSITWELDTQSGVLTLNGSGAMANHSGDGPYAPWASEELRSLITSVAISDSITHIGNYAFINCTGLTSVTLPDSIKSIGDGAFQWCRALANISIPETVTTIGTGAFYDCTSLSSIVIPESVTRLGSSIFSGCKNLSKVNIPKNIKRIEGGSFYRCESLAYIELPDSISEIGNSAFTFCTALTTLKLPEAVTKIGSGAFSFCTSLTSINIPEGVTQIIDQTFKGCTSLVTLHLPDNMTTIGWRAFENCENLSFINIPKWTVNAYHFAFDGCPKLEVQNPIILYGEMTDPVEEYSGLIALTNLAKEVELAGIMKYVPRCLFADFSQLKKVTLNEEIKQIRSFAFKNCQALTELCCKATVPPAVYPNAFSGTNLGNVTLFVPDGSIEAYSKDDIWSKFGTIKTFSGEEVGRCATPTISFVDGKLEVSCETEGAVCYYSMGTAILPSTDFTKFEQSADCSREVSVMVSAYAVAEGYTQSEIATTIVKLGMNVTKSDTVFVERVVEKRDTVLYEKKDTVFVEKFDSVFIEKSDTVFLEKKDTIIVEKWDSILVEKLDTVLVEKWDSILVEKKDTVFVELLDTILVEKWDSILVEKWDTVFVEKLDTILVEKWDSIFVEKWDTIIVEKRDTLFAEVSEPKIIAENSVVTITCDQENVDIFYTVDGTAPLESENTHLYTGPFKMESSGVVMAIAVIRSDIKAEYVVGTGMQHAKNRIVRQRFFDANGIESPSYHRGVTVVLTEYENGRIETTKQLIR